MDKNDYVKVLLYAYPKLDALREAVECGVEVKAVLSFRARQDATAVLERIAEEIVIAKKLSLLKRKLDEVLSHCSEREMFLLEYKYFRRKDVLREKFAGYEPNCSERNYFRLQNALLTKIAALLLSVGMTERRFFREFRRYAPFMRVFRAIREGRERAVVFKRRDREIAFRQKSSGSGGAFLPRRTNIAMTTSAAAATQIRAICAPESPATGVLSTSPFKSSSTLPDADSK